MYLFEVVFFCAILHLANYQFAFSEDSGRAVLDKKNESESDMKTKKVGSRSIQQIIKKWRHKRSMETNSPFDGDRDVQELSGSIRLSRSNRDLLNKLLLATWKEADKKEFEDQLLSRYERETGDWWPFKAGVELKDRHFLRQEREDEDRPPINPGRELRTYALSSRLYGHLEDESPYLSTRNARPPFIAGK